MMKRRLLALLLGLTMLLPTLSHAETLQDCHRVKVTHTDTTQKNKSVIRLWTLDTACDAVDEELAAIAQEYVDQLGPTLQKAGNATSKNSRLEVETRYSRTGLTWMSFLVQARVTYHRALIGQEITSRTYDMTTGERIRLTDIFDADSEAWPMLEHAVRDTVETYFPDETPDAAALSALLTRESLENLDFTLHGMSLVLHVPAQLVYPEHQTLMEVTLFYPDIRSFMTAQAQIETDNLAYYKTVALTFDDGPDRTNTTKVLNTLLEVGGRATFFVVGNRISSYKDLVQREHDEGHIVAAHNWSHANVSKVSGSTLRAMPGKVNKALLPVIGIPVPFDRVPYGLYPQMIKAKTGWPLIQWSVDTYDWRGRSTNTIMNNVKKQFTDGDIVLMHDIKDLTPTTAKVMAEWLKENGYMLLTVEELMAKDGVKLEPDTVYFRCDDGVTTIKER